MEYQEINNVINADGLRIILVRGFPSPWGQAAKAMMEYKALDYIVGAQQARGENEALVNWAVVNSGPVVAWNNERPLNRWDDILMLLERLARNMSLIPDEQSTRVQFFGLAHAICGPLGFGWNRRLEGIHLGAQAGIDPGTFGEKYGYNKNDGERARQRSIDFMQYLTKILKSQKENGSDYIIGDSLTAVDFYWAAFSNLAEIQSAEDCPLEPEIRARFERVAPEVAAAVDPILIEHRDRIMHTYFKIPMEL
jgi:glutathione S-transferase